MAELMLVFGFMFVGFALFVIYFIFKQLQFVLVSVNLYKKMVRRQDVMLTLLKDIRDNTKHFQGFADDKEDENDTASSVALEQMSGESETDLDFCYHCGEELLERTKACPKCGKKL